MTEVEQMLNVLLDTQDRILKKTNAMNVKLSLIIEEMDTHATIEDLVQRYPNDQELGKAIRKQYKTKQNGNS